MLKEEEEEAFKKRLGLFGSEVESAFCPTRVPKYVWLSKAHKWDACKKASAFLKKHKIHAF